MDSLCSSWEGVNTLHAPKMVNSEVLFLNLDIDFRGKLKSQEAIG